MAIEIVLHQHRVQITAEWIDTDPGEVQRPHNSPPLQYDRRRVLQRFAGRRPLADALEATTGWRLVAEEFSAGGAAVHLAEPAETAARRGNKKRAKTDRADPAASARAVDDRAAARVVDPARAPARSTCACSSASHAG